MRNTNHYATVDSDKGVVVIELYPEVAPRTVANFERLARQGFYDGLTFHRVVADFVVQTGDPEGSGVGGSGYTIEAEIEPDERHLRGTVGAARTGDYVNPERRSSGSQFFICLRPQPALDGQYTIFGRVIRGMEAVDRIRVGDCIRRITLAATPP